MNQQVEIDHITITAKNGSKVTISRSDMFTVRVNKSAQKYVDNCYFQINNKRKNVYPLFDIDCELKIVGPPKYGPRRVLFHGIIKKKQRRWDNPKGLDFTEFWGYSFAHLGSLKMLYSWEMKYTNGYGEVIRNLARMISCEVKGPIEENKKGYLYFDHMSVLDVMRLLAYEKGWCISFHGKTIKFAPCEKPQHSGITINLQDLPAGIMTEG